jgi:hypothetical protein
VLQNLHSEWLLRQISLPLHSDIYLAESSSFCERRTAEKSNRNWGAWRRGVSGAEKHDGEERAGQRSTVKSSEWGGGGRRRGATGAEQSGEYWVAIRGEWERRKQKGRYYFWCVFGLCYLVLSEARKAHTNVRNQLTRSGKRPEEINWPGTEASREDHLKALSKNKVF